MEFLQTIIAVIIFMTIVLPVVLFVVVSYYRWLFKTAVNITTRWQEKRYKELVARRNDWKRIKNNASDPLTLADAHKMIAKLEAQMKKVLQ